MAGAARDAVPPRRTIVIALLVMSLSAGCGGGSGDRISFCDLARDKTLKNLTIDEPDDLRRAVDKLRASAPKQIKRDVETVAGASESLVDAGQDSARIDAALDRLESPTVTDASKRIESYISDHC